MPRSDLCDNSDVYTVVKGTIVFLAAAQMKMIKYKKHFCVKI